MELNALAPVFSFFCLTETHLDHSISDGELLDSRFFDIYRNDRNLNGGGVLVAASNKFFHSALSLEIEDFPIFPLEVVVVFIPRQNSVNTDIILACVYIPPSVSHLAIDPLYNLLSVLTKKYQNANIYITGDFNMPDIDWANGTVKKGSNKKGLHQDFINCFNEFGFHQLISNSTHIKGNTLDLIFVNSEKGEFSPSIINPGLSDHYMIEIDLNLHFKSVEENRTPQTIKLYNKADKDKIVSSLECTENQIRKLIDKEEGIDRVWDTFTHSMHTVIEKYVPTITVRPRGNGEPYWFNNKARKLVNKQRQMYNKYKRSGQEFHLQQYKLLRKNSKKTFRKLQNDHLNNRLFSPMAKGDSKCFYRFLKAKSGKSNNIKSINSSKQPGLRLEDPREIADELNQYFKSVFNPNLGNTPYPVFSCSTIKVTKEGVKKLLCDLKLGKAPGPDGLKKVDLCLAIDEVTSILTTIFQYSLDIGRLPMEWKRANVVPIFKSGSKLSAANYRPVSLTCICSKMLEHIILHNMSSKLNDILIPQQHGFRKGLSCTSQLLTTTQSIMREVDKGGCVQAAVLDFSKAFDKVSHSLLMSKLFYFGFSNDILSWILDFLSDRSQRVVLNGFSSNAETVTSGVPQGSVLGPALFLLYINDIGLSLTSTIRLYADDALLHSPITGTSSVEAFQKDLDSLEKWANEWQMSFNTSKCSVIIFGSTKSVDIQSLQYRLNNVVLNIVDSIKYLGVTITSDFNWNEHIVKKHSEAVQTLGMLRRNISAAPPKIKLIAYKALCRPKMEFALEVWDPSTKKYIQLLEMVQNRATRFISNLKGRDGVTREKENLGLVPLQERRKIQRIKTLHDILKSSDPSFKELNDFIDTCFKDDRPQTRAKSKGQPLAISTSRDTFLNSFIPRTTRDLRI